MTQAAHREVGRMVSVSSLMLGCCLFPTPLLALPSDKVKQTLYPNGFKQVTQEEGEEKQQLSAVSCLQNTTVQLPAGKKETRL